MGQPASTATPSPERRKETARFIIMVLRPRPQPCAHTPMGIQEFERPKGLRVATVVPQTRDAGAREIPQPPGVREPSVHGRSRRLWTVRQGEAGSAEARG